MKIAKAYSWTPLKVVLRHNKKLLCCITTPLERS